MDDIEDDNEGRSPSSRIPEPSAQVESLGLSLETLKEVWKELPQDASIRDVLNVLCKEDPYIWAMMHRRIKGSNFVCDNSKNLTPDVLKKLKGSTKNKEKFEREVKARLGRHRPYLIQPLRDTHPHQAYMKGRQIGMTEAEINKSLAFVATNPHTKVVYTFPRLTNLQTFVNTRINPSIQETPALKKLVGVPNGVETKKIGDSFLIFRSSWDPALGEGVDADVLVLDEKDRMNANVEHAFKDSLSASKYGWMRELSTPSLPGRGIHASFSESDQMTWLVRCERCNLEQEIDWQENILQMLDFPKGSKEIPDNAFMFVCRLMKCRGALNRLVGRWVPKKPGNKNIRGYHMPQMIFALISATELMKKKFTGNRPLQHWLNYEIGVPSTGDSNVLSEQDYDYACSGHKLTSRRTPYWSEVSVGIDWGRWNWVTVLGLNTNGGVYIIGLFAVQDDDYDPLHIIREIDRFITPFNPDIVIADKGYGQDRNPHLLKRWGIGRFYACEYSTEIKSRKALESGRQASKGRFAPQWGGNDSVVVKADKMSELSKTCHMIKERALGVPSYDQENMIMWKKHFQNLVPMTIEDPDTGELISIIDRKGDDHFAQATNYGRIGLARLAELGSFGFVGM